MDLFLWHASKFQGKSPKGLCRVVNGLRRLLDPAWTRHRSSHHSYIWKEKKESILYKTYVRNPPKEILERKSVKRRGEIWTKELKKKINNLMGKMAIKAWVLGHKSWQIETEPLAHWVHNQCVCEVTASYRVWEPYVLILPSMGTECLMPFEETEPHIWGGAHPGKQLRFWSNLTSVYLSIDFSWYSNRKESPESWEMSIFWGVQTSGSREGFSPISICPYA